MKKYRVRIAVKTLEIYEVEAADREEAAASWDDGTLVFSCDETLESEILSVKEV